MALPIKDLKDIFTAGSDAVKRREEPVRVAIFVQKHASESHINLLRDALIPQLSSGMIHVSEFEQADQVTVNTSSDICIILGYEYDQCSHLYHSILKLNIPPVVLTDPESMIARSSHYSSRPIPVSDLLVGDADKKLLSRLASWILKVQKDKDLAFAANFPFVRKTLADKIVADTAKQNALVGGVVIIPGADMPVMTANQAWMILQIAAAYGQELSSSRLKELIPAIASGFAMRTIARQVLAVIPAAGWAVKAGIGYSGTLAMGKAVTQYFEEGGSLGQITEKMKAQAKGLKSQKAHDQGFSQYASEQSDRSDSEGFVEQVKDTILGGVVKLGSLFSKDRSHQNHDAEVIEVENLSNGGSSSSQNLSNDGSLPNQNLSNDELLHHHNLTNEEHLRQQALKQEVKEVVDSVVIEPPVMKSSHTSHYEPHYKPHNKPNHN